MKTKLPVPDEIHELFCESDGAAVCRDNCIASMFKAKRAVYYAKQSRLSAVKAWRLTMELHPQVKDGNWKYLHYEQCVCKVGAGDE